MHTFIMRTILFSLFCLLCNFTFAQKVVLKAGTLHTTGAIAASAIVAAPLIFLTGQHAAIPAGYTNVTTVKVDTDL